jgi:hypothetical protein
VHIGSQGIEDRSINGCAYDKDLVEIAADDSQRGPQNQPTFRLDLAQRSVTHRPLERLNVTANTQENLLRVGSPIEQEGSHNDARCRDSVL